MNNQFEYWGIDGCKTGWCCIGLGAENSEYCHFVGKDIAGVYECIKSHGAKIALIDIPIGFSDNELWRDCDKKARESIGKRYNSVFPVPCRKAVNAYHEDPGSVASRKLAAEIAQLEDVGKNLNPMSWAIFPKIAEVDNFLIGNTSARKLIREIHPEVCFWALNRHVSLEFYKKDKKGAEERIRILGQHIPNSGCIIQGMDDDFLDAFAAAITAKIGYGRYKTLPEKPERDSCGLPMEMVYA